MYTADYSKDFPKENHLRKIIDYSHYDTLFFDWMDTLWL